METTTTTTTTTSPDTPLIRLFVGVWSADLPFSAPGEIYIAEGDVVPLYFDGDLNLFYGWIRYVSFSSTKYQLVSRNPICLTEAACFPFNNCDYYPISYNEARSLGFPDADGPSTTTPGPEVVRNYALFPSEATIRSIVRAEMKAMESTTTSTTTVDPSTTTTTSTTTSTTTTTLKP